VEAINWDEVVRIIGVQRGVSKGVEDGRKLPTLWVGHPGNGRFRSGPPQGVEGLGMASPAKTLGSPRSPLAIRLC
jgi:hypothetical protein